MKIKVTQTVDVPRDFYCGNCLRKEQDKKGQWFCGIYNRFLWMAKGKTVKCMETVKFTTPPQLPNLWQQRHGRRNTKEGNKNE